MNRKVAVFMATGFEEMELTIVVDILRRAEIEVLTVSLNNDGQAVCGSRGIKMLPDITIADFNTSDFDMIVLPGGLEGTQNLAQNDQVLEAIRVMHQQEKMIAAICAAPVVLVKAGIAAARKLTSHPAAADHMLGVSYQEDRVVVDKNIITSRAAGTTFEFAYRLIEQLLSKAAAEEVNKGVLAKA